MPHTRFPDLIAALPETVPFVGPETQERARGQAFAARLGANESVFGPSPFAVAAMKDAAAEVWQYGDPTAFDLRRALAAIWNCTESNIVVGEGIDGLLGTICRLMIEPGDHVVTSAGAYPTFNYHVAACGGALALVPYRDDHEDIDALLTKAAQTRAKIIYLANPDNPMGSVHPGQAIEAMAERLPQGTLLVLDEAYAEFAGPTASPTLDPNDSRILRLRTFSKAYGMAGARIGYAIGAPVMIRAFDKIRNHFGVNRLAQAGALAALEDGAWLDAVQRQVSEGRSEIARIARAEKLVSLPSATNFVAIDCGRDGAFAATLLDQLISEGIFVRMPGVAPLNRCIRVTVGRPDDLALFASALPVALERARETV